MSLLMSMIFSVFGVVALTLAVVIAIYMVLGLLLVDDLRFCDSEYKLLQLQAQFLADGVAIPSAVSLQNNTICLDSPCPVQSKNLQLTVERL